MGASYLGSGLAWRVGAVRGWARQGKSRRDEAWPVRALHGEARRGLDLSWPGETGLVQSGRGLAELGLASPGSAWRGAAQRGQSRHGTLKLDDLEPAVGRPVLRQPDHPAGQRQRLQEHVIGDVLGQQDL